MSESKKVALVSFPGSKTADKDAEKVPKTIRISFDLSRADEDTCPIFNYKEELASAKKREKLAKYDVDKSLHNDPFPDQDDDDDVRRIVNEMEAKYGISSATKKKRKGRKDDYADIGMGYDESDSFIDNTDGYDEMIPQNVTTLHGGFYINCGALEFKTDEEASSNIYSSSSSDDSSDADEQNTAVKRANKKRALSESDDEMDKKRPAKNPKLANNQQKLKKNYLSPYKIKPKKKRVLPAPIDLPTEETPAEIINKQTAVEDDTDNKPTKDNDNVLDVINSVAKGDRVSYTGDVLNSLASCSTPVEYANHVHEDGDKEPNCMPNDVAADSKVEPIKVHEEELVLPENLPSNILTIINAIKQTASANIANNTSVFSSQVNNLIISFESKCKCLGKQSRSQVYAYLAAFTKCDRASFIRRARNLVLQEDDARLKLTIDLLRKKINEVMPGLKDNYENMRSHIEMRKLFNEDVKNMRMPKKTFPWSEKIKRWIRDIYSLKRKYLISQGVDKEILDSQLESFFKSDIHILWPDSWVSMNYLIKVARIDPITTDPNKPTKHQTGDKDDNTSNMNGNTAPALKVISGVLTKQTVNNDETNNKSEPSAKTTDATKVHTTKNSEQSVFVVPAVRLMQKPNLPQVSITPVSNPTVNQTQTNSVDCEVVKRDDEQQKENRIRTISEILKMNRAKKDAAAAAAAAAAAVSNKRSSSPGLVNSMATCQIIDLTSNSPDLDQVKKRAKYCAGDIVEDTSVVVQQKAGQDTAEIQKVMEDLKALQQMTYSQSTSSQQKPSASDSTSLTVTALNKNGSKTSAFSSSGETTFQEAFQRQFVASLQNTASSSALPNSYNSSQDKIATNPSTHQIRNDINTTVPSKIFEPNSTTSVKNNSHPSKNRSAYNIMDDMLANFLSEYGYPLTGQKPKKPSQK